MRRSSFLGLAGHGLDRLERFVGSAVVEKFGKKAEQASGLHFHSSCLVVESVHGRVLEAFELAHDPLLVGEAKRLIGEVLEQNSVEVTSQP